MSISPARRFFSNVWEVLEVILIAAGTVLIIRTFIVAPFQVSGASMEPTLIDDEYLLIDEITYRFRAPERGEVVVFKYPNDDREHFIKRIIALPGETVSINNGEITITPASHTPSFTLDEPYLDEDTVTRGEKFITLGPDEYFVMGDNRENSFDSRNWGALNKQFITGVVRLRLFPISRFQGFEIPNYTY